VRCSLVLALQRQMPGSLQRGEMIRAHLQNGLQRILTGNTMAQGFGQGRQHGIGQSETDPTVMGVRPVGKTNQAVCFCRAAGDFRLPATRDEIRGRVSSAKRDRIDSGNIERLLCGRQPWSHTQQPVEQLLKILSAVETDMG